MSDLVPAPPPSPSVLAPLTDPAGGPALVRLRAFAGQEPVRRALPWFGAMLALGGAGLAWATLAPAPQRVLYAQLEDAERADVVAALDKGGVAYRIDSQTGALSVDEPDLYRARMLVAAEDALASPESGAEMVASLPLGASRTLEGERLRAARERELMLTIMEVDGIEAVRVHLAAGEQSAFVRDERPPSASVMVRLARGRQLSQGQVSAIANLVAASVPGLAVDAVKVADQHGRLLSERTEGAGPDRLHLQAALEEKLRGQLAQLLTPVMGEGNFTSEVQVELDMDDVTSARESYEKEGAVRTETQAASQSGVVPLGAGVPGVLSNTPPPATTAQAGAPQGGPPVAPASAGGGGESRSTRTYELGREVAVANSAPGKVKRLSVAVALSAKALKSGKAGELEQIRQLVSAAVGADAARGDQVAVVARTFGENLTEAPPVWETPWFAGLVRTGVALLAVLLVLLLGVRPMVKALRRERAAPADDNPGEGAAPARGMGGALPGALDAALLGQQVGLAQRLAAEKPDRAVEALRQMLADSPPEAAR